MDPVRLKQLVVFAILMENGEGVVDKSPDYIEEKHVVALMTNEPETLLDPSNRAKFERWLERWS